MSEQASPGKWGDLWQRLASGGLAALVGLYLMWIGGLPFKLLVSAIVGLMVWEVARMSGAGKNALPLGVLAALVMVAVALFPTGLVLPLIFLPALIGISKLGEYRVRFSLFSSAILIAGLGIFVLREDFGFIWMLWLALVVIASDVLGYFAGRVIGGPKFWPKVSPKKTWSGTLAGWAGAALIGLWFVSAGHAGVEIIGISIAIAIAGQMGDVAESALKRSVGVKDSSSILPGHGGMFDRFDSMLGASLFLLLVEQIIDFPPVPL
ncbi:MAG: phosphatidate cytidylyltransferase [Paracoccaceae bacterium]|nr:phosphatidate cytidylyltransferase [Paracoccaceae bacterium]